MAVVSSLQKVSVNMKLNGGTSASGGIAFLTVPLGTLSVSNYDPDKAYAICDKFRDLFPTNKPLYSIQEVDVKELQSE